MCGIAGILNFNNKKIDESLLKKMTNIIRHRGPDGEGMFIDKNIGLGHRRLAIIDLSDAAAQPMFNENKKIVLVYNGEIYNFMSLRKELIRKGHKFISKSDTEVILHGYEEEGINFINKLNGLFAFALWDKRKKELYLARDRYGIKPLYYFKNDVALIFASEIKSIL